jgi:two-component system sensor histidine kinase/response regulator
MLVKKKPLYSIAADLSRGGIVVESLRGARVLLVDDDEFNLASARGLLESAGIAVTTAVNGALAIAELRCGTFDCVLMDVQMPVLDGLAAVRQIRADAVLCNTLVLAFTSNASGPDREKCMRAGMNDVLQKPAEPQSLFLTLALWLAVKRLPAAHACVSPP